jgi:hypothetical protein
MLGSGFVFGFGARSGRVWEQLVAVRLGGGDADITVVRKHLQVEHFAHFAHFAH